MKLKLIIAAAVMAFGTVNTASAQISNIFSKIKSAVSETLGTSSNNIEGTWGLFGSRRGIYFRQYSCPSRRKTYFLKD